MKVSAFNKPSPMAAPTFAATKHHSVTKYLILLVVMAASAIVNAQTVVGTIKDNKGELLPGISILVQGTFSGTSSKNDGTFQLSLPAGNTYALVAQGIGFTSKTQNVTGGANDTITLDFILEPAINSLKEITVTAGRKAEIIDRTPATVQVINSREIQSQMMVSPNINNILASAIPSLGYGTNTTSNTGQTLRGRNPLILIDGIPQSTPLRAGGRDLRTIDAATIERIEVVKGATAIYGNGADGGIINYITKKPLKGSPFNAYTYIANTGMLAHANNTRGVRLTQQFSGNLNKFDYVVSGTYEKTGVYKDAKGKVLTPVYGLGETGIGNVFAKAGFNFTPTHRFEAMYNYFGSSQNSKYVEQMGKYLQTPTIGIDGKTLGVDEGTRYNHNGYVKYLAKNLFLNTELDASVYMQSFKTVYGFTTFFQNGGQSTLESNKKGLRVNFNTPYTAAKWFKGDVVYGVDVMSDITSQKLTDGRTWVPEMEMRNAAPYLQASANLFNNWIVKAGYRFDAASIDVPDFTQIIDATGAGGKSIKGGNVTFNASTFNTGLRFAKWEVFKPFISYTQGFSIIDIGRFVRAAKENDLAKMQIEPVVVNNYEAGFSSNFKWLSFTGSYFISTNKIGASLVEENGWYVQQKAPEKTYGFEGALDVTPIPELKAGVAYAVVEGKADINKNNSFDDETDRYLTGLKIPPPKTTAYIRYSPVKAFNVMVQYNHFGDRQRFAVRSNGKYGSGEGPVQGNHWVNLSSAWQVNKRFSLNLGIENLLNNDFFMPQAQWSAQDGDYIKANGARYQLGVGIKW
jgi:iron complex outermembrane recepter protein